MDGEEEFMIELFRGRSQIFLPYFRDLDFGYYVSLSRLPGQTRELEVVYEAFDQYNYFFSAFKLFLSTNKELERFKVFVQARQREFQQVVLSIRQRRRLATVAHLIFLVLVATEKMPITRTLTGIKYFHEVNGLVTERGYSINAFIKAAYHQRGFYEGLLKKLGLSWPGEK